MFSFREYTLKYQDPVNFANVSIFLRKITIFVKNSTFTQSNSTRAMLEIFSSVFSFFARLVTINKNVTFIDHASGIRLQDWFK